MDGCTDVWTFDQFYSSLPRRVIKPVKCLCVLCMRPSMCGLHFQNPKALTPLGRYRRHLACVFCGWLRGTVLECRSLTGELSLLYARSAADG